MLSLVALSLLAQLPPSLLPLPRPLVPPPALVVLDRPIVPRWTEPNPPQPQPQPQPRTIQAGTVLTFWVDGLPGRDRSRAWQLTEAAASIWSGWADIDFIPSRDRHTANIVIVSESIFRHYLGLTDMGGPSHYRDGRKGVKVRINSDRSIDDDLMLRVLTHEIGHALGLDHASPGTTMGAAVHSRTPFTQSDGQAAARLYGGRRVATR